MKVSIRTIAATAFVALLVPLAAVAKESEVNGPAALAGKGFFGGDLTMTLGDDQRPVRIGAHGGYVGILDLGGYVGILDLGGDLKVRCQGKGRVNKKETEQGVVYMCAGRGGQAIILGSHFKFRGFAMRYRALLPAGTSGTFHGRFVECTKTEGETGEAKWSCGGDERGEGVRERAGEKRDGLKERAQEKRDGLKEKATERGEKKPGASQDDEVPTLAELAALLAGK